MTVVEQYVRKNPRSGQYISFSKPGRDNCIASANCPAFSNYASSTLFIKGDSGRNPDAYTYRYKSETEAKKVFDIVKAQISAERTEIYFD